MKKTIISAMLMCFAFMQAMAVNLVVSGSWNSDMNGLYVETGTQNDKPYFVKSSGGGMNYAIGYDGCCSWRIGQEMMPGDIMDEDQSSDAGDPPLTGWMQITVAIEGKSISKDKQTLFESKMNDGKLEGVVHFSINKFNGEVFTGNVGDDFLAMNKVTLTNLPAGLTANLLKLSDSTLVLKINGSATNHTQAENTTLNVSFLNASVSGGDTSEVGGYNQNIAIKFRNLYTVASSGADFTTVTAAAAQAQNGDIVKISGETFTEVGISVPKSIIIQGEGANKTIIQAAASPNTANGRVFTVTAYDSVEFVNLTIQNGNFISTGNPYGGGVKSDGYLVFKNCAIKNNSAAISGNANNYAAGGGIYCVGLTLINCELTNNSLSGAGQTTGGGASSGHGMQIVNSTIANNIVTTTYGASFEQGGGLYSNGGNTYIINSTITANSARTGAGYYATNSSYQNVQNSIIYGNTNGLDFVTNLNYNKNSEAHNSIIGASSDEYFNIATTNVISNDPLLSTLANNGGATQTIAILANSPAINAGATGVEIPKKDQRGYYANGTRDIGAYEFDALACMKPMFTLQPVDAEYCVGDSIHFYSEANGDSISYASYFSFDKLSFVVPLENSKQFDGFASPSDLAFSGGYIVFTGTNGCGSDTSDYALIVLNYVDTTVTLNEGELTVNADNVTYQWIDCDNNGAVIDGATSKSYMPTKTGNYAVIVDNNKCAKDTSSCHYVELTLTGLEKSSVSNFTLFPNPASDNVTITLTETVSGTVSILDLHGNVVATKSISGTTSSISTADVASGVYVVKINSDKGVAVKQLVVQ